MEITCMTEYFEIRHFILDFKKKSILYLNNMLKIKIIAGISGDKSNL